MNRYKLCYEYCCIMYPSTRPARCVHSCPHLSACSLAMLHVLDVFGSTRYSVSRSANNDILSMAMDNFIMNLTWHGDGVARFRRYQVEWPVMSGVTVMFWQAEVPKFTLKGGNPGRSAYSQIWLYIVIVWGRECLLFNYCILNMYIYIYNNSFEQCKSFGGNRQRMYSHQKKHKRYP